jgi:hypothetical protein
MITFFYAAHTLHLSARTFCGSHGNHACLPVEKLFEAIPKRWRLSTPRTLAAPISDRDDLCETPPGRHQFLSVVPRVRTCVSRRSLNLSLIAYSGV